jgi:myo-inositol 2-dehydrogenase / D-chiro-inositol 1-dehydrogenase
MAVSIGVIGTGVMGAEHARRLAAEVDGADVVAVADADSARAAAAAAAAGGRAHTDALELIRSDDVDAVVVASSDATHADFVLACLAEGKPVLCEKPLANTAEASLLVAEAEAASGRRLVQVGFMRRYDPAYTAMKRELDEGRVGDPLLMHCVHRNAGVPPSYTSEMLITSSLTHEIDVVRWLMGEEIVTATVLAPRSSSRAGGIRDPQLAILETEGGILVDVEVFANAGYGYDIRCEIVGEEGRTALPEAVAPSFLQRFPDAYRIELQDWVDAVAEGGLTGPSAWDGYAASAVADACLASLAGGGPVEVRLAQRLALYA